jgi:hypothetical protein
MSSRARYKVGDKVEFWFAGSSHKGSILQVRKDTSKESYLIEAEGYKYPVQQDKITKKL